MTSILDRAMSALTWPKDKRWKQEPGVEESEKQKESQGQRGCVSKLGALGR